ncbi:MAG: prepilin peptidase [Tissierellia bacterium]|nr:prepilin peptidase [Tissierellia bacterium]
MIYVFSLVLGLVIGSFNNLVVTRLIRNESIVFPNSHCDSCGRKLRYIDMIPVISFINLKARCRYCNEKIPVDNLINELLTGFIFIISTDHIIYNPIFLFNLLVVLILIIVSEIDLKTMDIYMRFIYIIGILGFVYRIMHIGFDMYFIKFIIIFSLSYLLIYYISKKSIGDGDLFLYLSLFLFVDNNYLIKFVLLSIWIGAIFSIFVAIKNKTMKLKIPFTPFITIAFFLIQYGIINWSFI